MYDKGKIGTAIILFLIVLMAPGLYNVVTGGNSSPPVLKTGTDEKKCIEETPFMKTSHMTLLNQWKEEVVRNNGRSYRARDGKTYAISLTGTCMKCHSNKEEFCDRCHNYTAVKPYCWDCHNVPKAAGK